jgi:hypothetical protein
MSKSDDGFAISSDCSKIIQSVDYTDGKSAFNEIYLYDIDGQNKKVLLSQKEDETNELKQIVSWSKKDLNIVYLIDAKWDHNGGQQNLYKLDITNGQIQQVTLPVDCYNWDLSDNENKIACSTENYDKSSVVDFISGAREKFSNTSSGKRLFSPSGNGLANEDFICTGTGNKAKCTNDLYFFDGKQNKKLLSNSSIYGWLSENAILASKDGALVQVNPITSEVKNIIKADYNWIYFGIENGK